MSIQNNLSLNAVPEAGNWGALPDTATIGSEWTDLSRLRQLAGSFCPQEAQQIASQIIPDDLNLESVFKTLLALVQVDLFCPIIRQDCHLPMI